MTFEWYVSEITLHLVHRAVRRRESQVRTRRRLSDAGGGARGPPRSTGAGEGSA